MTQSSKISSKSQTNSYDEWTLKALKRLTEENTGPFREYEICVMVAKLKNGFEDIAEYTPSKEQIKAVQSGVSRALQRLEIDGVRRLEEAGRFPQFYLDTSDVMYDVFAKYVFFTSPVVFPISATTFLIEVTPETTDNAIVLLKSNFPDCFLDIIPFEKYLMLLVKPEVVQVSETADDVISFKKNPCIDSITKIVEDGYRRYMPEERKKKTITIKQKTPTNESNPDSVNP